MISQSRRLELRSSPKQAKAVARQQRARKKAREEEPLSIQAVLKQCKSLTPAERAKARKEIRAMNSRDQQEVLKALATSTAGPKKRG